MLYLTAPQAQSCCHQTCSSNLRRLDRKRLSSTYRLRCPPSSRVPDRIRNRSNSLMRLKVRLHIPRHSFHIIHLSIYPPTSPNAPQVQPSILSGPAQLTQQLALRIVTQLERRFNVSGCQQAMRCWDPPLRQDNPETLFGNQEWWNDQTKTNTHATFQSAVK